MRIEASNKPVELSYQDIIDGLYANVKSDRLHQLTEATVYDKLGHLTLLLQPYKDYAGSDLTILTSGKPVELSYIDLINLLRESISNNVGINHQAKVLMLDWIRRLWLSLEPYSA